MKVAEFLKKCESMPKENAEFIAEYMSIWSNEACCGYCIRAMEIAGADRVEILDMLHHLKSAFDELTEEEAEALWRKW